MPPAPDDAPFTEIEISALLSPAPVGGALLAVSGGSDSLALMHVMHRHVAAGANGHVVVATVDHGLREGSAKEAEAVAAQATALGFDPVTLVWTGAKPRTGIQDAARSARYRLLFDEARARGLARILTAHTLDDQAETVLMRLLRRSGVKGLGAMAREIERDGLVLQRPFLRVSRARLRSYLRVQGVSWIDDPSNTDDRFLRPRLRRLAPLLAAEGLDAEAIADVAHKLRRADSALDHAARHASALICRDAECVTIARAEFGGLPTEIAMRVLVEALNLVVPLRHPPDDAQVEALVHWVAGNAKDRPRRRTLAGVLIDVSGETIRLSPAPPRRVAAK